MMNFLFGNTNGENILPDLKNVEVISDRAYWTMALIYGFLLIAGKAIHGTLKRAFNWSFTFDQVLSKGNKRTVVSKYSPPLLCLKKLVYNGVKLTLSAFRSGTNKISTTISNIHHDKYWDRNLIHSKDDMRYEHVCLKKDSFRKIERNGDDNESSDLKDRIESLNLFQLHYNKVHRIEVELVKNHLKVEQPNSTSSEAMQESKEVDENNNDSDDGNFLDDADADVMNDIEFLQSANTEEIE
eukprot:827355-Ditylum_brightwellii.AAC.1